MIYPVISLPYIMAFLTILVRVIGIFTTAPILGTKIIPNIAKVGLGLFLSYMIFSITPNQINYFRELHFLTYSILLISETIIGILLGFVASLIFNAIQFGGRLIDISMGMHIASVVDPLSSEQQSLVGQFQYILCILFFLSMNGHHLILTALLKSFSITPIGTLTFTASFANTLMQIITTSFIIGIQLAGPVVATLFLVDFSLGIIAKGVPQMNVFLTGMPLKSLVGFLIVFATFPFYHSFFKAVPALMYEQIIAILKVI